MSDGLDRAVVRTGKDAKSLPQPPDGLMMRAVDREACAIQLAQKAGQGIDRVEAVGAVDLAMACDMLAQRAAEIDVEDLQPAANADDLTPSAKKIVDERKLTRVALLVDIRRALDRKSADAYHPRREEAERPRAPALRRARRRPERALFRNFSGVPINRLSSYAEEYARNAKKDLARRKKLWHNSLADNSELNMQRYRSGHNGADSKLCD